MYDAIVVGARCAGSSTAMLLARAGHRVLVLDRARPGTDKLSTLYIHQPGVARLARWGLLDAVRDGGCPPLDRPTYRVADVRLHGPGPLVEGNRAAYAPRRFRLDAILAGAAAASGADVRHHCSLLGLLHDDDGRVTGVRYRDAGGAERAERARVVVGADGMRSMVGRLAGAVDYAVAPKLTCAYYSYWEDLPSGFEQYEGPQRWVGVIPTDDRQVLVAAYFPQREFERIRPDAAEHYAEAIRTAAPGLAERMRDARRVERMFGTGDQPNYLRTASGPGWALVGDAGHHKDSLTARGITDAFLQAELFAGCVGPAADGRDLDAALTRFAAERDPVLETGYRSTLSVARLHIAEERLRMLRTVQASPELTERYFAAAAGALSAEEFSVPELAAAS